MARYQDRERAIILRKEGMSYSAIKEKLGVSKSTLSNWLSDMPLSPERINRLRANSPQRIEKFRNTMRVKREGRKNEVLKKVEKEIGEITPRELFIAGFFLYWAEGGKTQSYNIALANTDPSMLRVYLKWLYALGVSKESIRIRLHLYADMKVVDETEFWAKQLQIKTSQFRKPHIKESRLSGLTRRGFGHGTCNIVVDGRDMAEYVLQGIRCIGSKY